MSQALELLRRALETRNEAETDRLAVEAIAADPDLGAAYALRGRLAARRAEVVEAAHHFRVAYARGDRTDDTRAALALCLDIVGQGELARRIREGAVLGHEYDVFTETAPIQAAPLRQIFASGLPARGQPALLPGERMPAPRSTGEAPLASAAPAPVNATATARPMPPGAMAVVSMTPARSGSTIPPAGRTVTVTAPEQSAVRPPAVSLPPPAPEPLPPTAAAASAAPVVQRGRRLPEWFEPTFATGGEAVRSEGVADWLVSTADAVAPRVVSQGIEMGLLDDAPLELGADPGTTDVTFRSSVTGRVVRPNDVAGQRALGSMPEIVRGPDLLGARASFEPDLPRTADLVLAIELPGPVLTAPGQAPRPLCKRVALGLTRLEVLLRDLDKGDAGAVRVPVSSIQRVDLVNDGQQCSLILLDGRQVHLDLRALQRSHPTVVQKLVGRLDAAVRTLRQVLT